MNRLGKRAKKENKNNRILVLFLLLFIILFIVSFIKVIKYYKSSKDNERIFEELSKYINITEESLLDGYIKNTKYTIDFNNLRKQNSDIVAFIKVNGTDIEQIVVKGNDNSYYLNHNFEKKTNSAGWIFADYRNKFDGTDKNIIIYGHNMRNGTMFASLKNILTDEWIQNEENRNIILVTENGKYSYKVFSVYQIKDEDNYLKIDFSKDSFGKYVNELKSRSIYDFNVEVGEEDNILTLSTCGNSNKYRVLLHAKREK